MVLVVDLKAAQYYRLVSKTYIKPTQRRVVLVLAFLGLEDGRVGQFSWLQTAQEAFSRVFKSLTPQYEINYCTKKGKFVLMHLIFSRWYEIFKAFTEGDQHGSYGQLKHRKPEEILSCTKKVEGRKKKLAT